VIQGGDQLLRDRAWSPISMPSFSALVSLLASTSAPVMSMSVLVETEDALVAPAFSYMRWEVGAGTFSLDRGPVIKPVITTVLPASGASDATTGGRTGIRLKANTTSTRRQAGSRSSNLPTQSHLVSYKGEP
jgi:hypothetical protein